MLKILERCLESDPKLCKVHELDQITKNIQLIDIRTICGKTLIN